MQPPVVFFTGAGISAGAGLPTYRGPGGLYEGTDREPPHARDVTRERLPALWARFAARLEGARDIRPSAAHYAIARLAERVDVVVVTQNVDGLHQDAGAPHVLELHGSLRRVRCLSSGHRSALAEAAPGGDGVPRCPVCGDGTRPDVVLFGEALPGEVFRAAAEAIDQAGTVAAVGTSGQVHPAAGLVAGPFGRGTLLLWVNPEHPPPTSAWIWRRGSADDEVVALTA